MNKKNLIKKLIGIFFIAILLITFFNSSVDADMGEKPSITITLKNMNTNDYIIDLFVYDESNSKYNDEANYNGSGLTNEEINMIHSLNFNGWISEGTRWNSYWLFADCAGNTQNIHYFSYFGTPDTYKVLIYNKQTGEIKLSDIINRTEFTSNITLDVNRMNIESKSSYKLLIYKILKAELLTLIVEIVIALIMKIKKIKLIIITNLLSNLILQILLVILPISYFIKFSILEILVIFAEYKVYTKYNLLDKEIVCKLENDKFKEKNISKKKLITYTIVANIASGIILPLIINVVTKIILQLEICC